MKGNLLTTYCCLLVAAVAAPRAGLAQTSVLYMQDTPSDNGTLGSRLGVLYESPDIWVQNNPIADTSAGQDAGYSPAPYANASPPMWLTAANQMNQQPLYRDPLKSQPNYVYVRIHNKSLTQSSTGTEQLRVYWSVAAAGLSWSNNFVDYMDNICGSQTVYGMEITKPRVDITKASPTDLANYLDAINKLATQTIALQTSGNYNNYYWFLQNEEHYQAVTGGWSGLPNITISGQTVSQGENSGPCANTLPLPPCYFSAHYSDAFLPWHREYLNRYEMLLRQFDPTVTLLYWNWTTDPNGAFSSTITSVIGGFGSVGSAADLGLPWNDTTKLIYSIYTGSLNNPPSPYLGTVYGFPNNVGRQTGVENSTGDSDSTLVNLNSPTTDPTAFSDFASLIEGRAPGNTGQNTHNNEHPYIGGNGNMSDLDLAAQDPFFFLLHANVDKLWSEWQRNDVNATPPNTAPYDPSLVTDSNTGDAVALAYTGTGMNMGGAMYPWNGFVANGSTGSQPGDRLGPYAVGGIYNSSVTANDHSIVFPPVYDNAPLTIPVLAPGQSVVIEIPWYPPNPENYASCLNSGQLHVCLLARIITAGPNEDGMDTTEETSGNDLGYNVQNNTRIAWHNEEVIDPPGPVLGGSVLVRNVLTNDATLQLGLTLAGSNNAALLNDGQMVLDLGNLYNNWVNGGSIAQDFVPIGGTQLQLTGTNGILSNIQVTGNEAAAVNVELTLNDGYTHPQGQQFAANFSETIQGITNGLVGGQIFTFDFNRLTIQPKGGAWLYEPTNQPDTNWNQVGYGDTNWSSGTGLLGYGLGGENTVINGNNYVTTYFRYDFGLNDVDLYNNLWLQLEAYDGAIVYLNGQEIASLRMPTNGIVTPDTLATSVATGLAAQTCYAFNVSQYIGLLNYNNVLAVEVHRGETNGTDLGFDGALIANIGSGAVGAANFPPQVAFESPTNGGMYLPGQSINFTADAIDPLTSISSVTFYADNQLISTAPVPPYTMTWNGATVGVHKLTAVATDSSGVTGNGYATVMVMSNLPPFSRIIEPVPGQVYTPHSVISFTASASEIGGSINNVNFYYTKHGPAFNNPQYLFGSATTPPYTVPLAAPSSPGCYMVTAVATDTQGVRGYSLPLNITVVAAPTLTVSNVAPYMLITWSPTNAVLQQSSTVTGSWQSLTNVSSPYGFIPNHAVSTMFYRVSLPLSDAICSP
jgi:hypothetical protein